MGQTGLEQELRSQMGRTVTVTVAGGHPCGADIEVRGQLVDLCHRQGTVWLVVADNDVILPLPDITRVA